MLRLVVFMTVVPLVWLSLHAYLGRRLVRGFALQGHARTALWGAIGVAAIIPLLVFIVGRASDGTWINALMPTGFLLMGLSSILFVFIATIDLVRLGAYLVQRRRAAQGTVDASRRSFLHRAVNLGVVGSAGSLVGVGYAQAGQVPDVVEVEVPVPGLPASAAGFRIVQLTDVHIGPTLRREFLAEVVKKANALEADVIAVTGDLIDGWVDQLRHDVAPLGDLRARHGTFFVTGNHEYYWDGLGWCDEVARLGLTVLVNEHRVIEHEGARILLAGVPDYSAGGMVKEHASDPARARAGAPLCDVDILLAHQPRSIKAAAAAGYHLQISGHTHGGQFFPFNVFVHLVQPYVSGLHQHDDKTWIYVSRGTGYWGPPLRVGAPAEITLLRLVPA